MKQIGLISGYRVFYLKKDHWRDDTVVVARGVEYAKTSVIGLDVCTTKDEVIIALLGAARDVIDDFQNLKETDFATDELLGPREEVYRDLEDGD